jgi:hypothetical protein
LTESAIAFLRVVRDRFLVSLCNTLTKLLHPAMHSPIISQTMSELQTEYDTPWKDAIESYFEEFIAFFFPQAHGDIDWRQGYELSGQRTATSCAGC